jgi:protein subunit release factor A
MDSSDIVDKYFIYLTDFEESSLNPKDRAFTEIWHSLGLIQNSGLHNYLFDLEQKTTAISSYYRTYDLTKCANILELGYDLYIEYTKAHSSDSSADEFRSVFEEEIDNLEESFYESEDEIVAALLPSCRTRDRLG